MADDVKTWYGPHACSVCGETIIKAAMEDGGAELNVPSRLIRIYYRGAESGDVEVVYPMMWQPHVHGTGNPSTPSAS